MADEAQIRRMLQQSLDLDLTPAEVCKSHPELFAAVSERWERCRQIDAELESIFSTDDPEANRLHNESESWSEIPQIPGYVIESILGRGGMGIVFKAHDVRQNRAVALKMLISGDRASPLQRARFIRETRSIAALGHEQIVQIFDVGEAGGLSYFAMEFLNGGTLAGRMAGTSQPVDRDGIFKSAALIATLADAVACAHAAGIIHRDLKPANILLTAEGVAKISDFGCARNVDGTDALTLTGVRMGTPCYMAPEQALGLANAIGPAADVYALGAVLYEMIAGRPPYRGASAADTVRQLTSGDPVPPSQLNKLVPCDLQIICLKCLRKDRVERYSSAVDLAADLRQCIRGLQS